MASSPEGTELWAGAFVLRESRLRTRSSCLRKERGNLFGGCILDIYIIIYNTSEIELEGWLRG